MPYFVRPMSKLYFVVMPSFHCSPSNHEASVMAYVSRVPSSFFRLTILLVLLSLLVAGGCATAPQATTAAIADVQTPVVRTREMRSEDYVVLIAESSDTYESLAATYLGDRKLAYLISEFNDNRPIIKGKDVVIPLKPVNPGGLFADGYMTVPVLNYHQFSVKKSTNKMIVSEETFARQMAYLKENGYNVITLAQFFDFIEYRRRPPPKSVLITIDDGWKSLKTIAYPILKKYGFTAVLFVYTDLIKNKPSSIALSWDDIREMASSGVIEVESHTVTHTDMTKLGEEQLRKELLESRRIIKEKTGITATFLAYPYGTFNDSVMGSIKETGYKAGFTVIRGSNAFFFNNFSLNRSMVFNSEKIADFSKLLDTFRPGIQ